MSSQDEPPFLSRWARRKQDAQRRPGDVAFEAKAGSAEEGTAKEEVAAAPVKPDQQAFDPATLPKVEDLTADSDITDFLRKGVPEELKRLALRRVWSLDPQIRDFVEVAENQYNWNLPDGVPGFGALPAGTDLKALLAQATGMMAAPVEVAEAAVSVAAPGPSVEAAKVAAIARKPAPEVAAFSESVSPVEPLGEPPEQAPTDDHPLEVARRRRHGGALPRSNL
jgi:hypothetical protein